MVVDDQPDVRFLVRVILGDHADLEVVAEAATAAEALERVAAAGPHVVTVDARMPIVDGFELTRALLARHPALRVALLTTVVDADVAAAAAAAGAAACVSKDDFDALPAIVRRLGTTG